MIPFTFKVNNQVQVSVQCLKITKNVAFKFSNFDISPQFLSY